MATAPTETLLAVSVHHCMCFPKSHVEQVRLQSGAVPREASCFPKLFHVTLHLFLAAPGSTKGRKPKGKLKDCCRLAASAGGPASSGGQFRGAETSGGHGPARNVGCSHVCAAGPGSSASALHSPLLTLLWGPASQSSGLFDRLLSRLLYPSPFRQWDRPCCAAAGVAEPTNRRPLCLHAGSRAVLCPVCSSKANLQPLTVVVWGQVKGLFREPSIARLSISHTSDLQTAKATQMASVF